MTELELKSVKTVVFSGELEEWPLWEFTYLALADQLGFLNLLEDAEADEEEDAARRKTLERQAYSHLVTSVKGDALRILRRIERGDVKAAWKALKEHYSSNNDVRKTILQEKLFSIKRVHLGAVSSFLDEVEEIVAQLGDIEVVIPEDVVWGCIHRGLHDQSEYASVLTLIQHDKTKRTLREKLAMIRLRAQELKITESSQEVVALRSTAKNVRNEHKFKTKPNKRICFRCNKPGHIARDCNVSRYEGGKRTTVKGFQSKEHGWMARTSTQSHSSKWFVDSAATTHITGCKTDFMELQDAHGIITTANGEHVNIVGRGKVQVEIADDKGMKHTKVWDVVYAPEITYRLFSVHQAWQEGARFVWGETVYIQGKNRAIFPIEVQGKDFLLHAKPFNESARGTELWHLRMGHASHSRVNRTVNGQEVAENVETKNDTYCQTCVDGKAHKEIQPRTPNEKAKSIGEIVHTDIAGPFPTSMGGKRYAIIFVDDYSRMRHVYFMHNKGEAAEKLKQYVDEVTRPREIYLKRIHSDNAMEYFGDKFSQICSTEGAVHTSSAPYTPAQNGVAERSWRIMVEMTRCMLLHAKLPQSFWCAAMDTACHINNRLPTAANGGISPYELWTGRQPTLGHLRVFGCPASILIENSNKKLNSRVIRGIFIGYSKKSKAYIIYLPETRSVRESRSVSFDEQSSSGWTEQPGSQVVFGLDGEEFDFFRPKDQNSEKPPEQPQVQESNSQVEESTIIQPNMPTLDHQECEKPSMKLKRDVKSLKSPEAMGPKMNKGGEIMSSRTRSKTNETALMVHANFADDEPRTVEEALSGEHAQQWKTAMEEEIQALKNNNTWVMVPKPENRKIIGCKWVLKIKRGSNGNIERFKARLVAQGYTQIEGIDYFETFAPVARLTTFRLLIAVASMNNWEIHQSDVSNAYLNGELSEEIFMHQPPKMDVGELSQVCKLKKSLYGLKQAGRIWNSLLHEWLQTSNFKRSSLDPCLYIKREGENLLILLVYVDDLAYTSNKPELVEQFQQDLSQRFNVRHDGLLSWFLGIRVSREKHESTMTYKLSQEIYIQKILKRFGYNNCKPSPTPAIISDVTLKNETCDSKPYREVIGALMYAMVATRPDIAFAVGRLSRYLDNPSDGNWQGATRALRYLKGTSEYCLTFNGKGNLEGYCDADFAGDRDSMKSTTGFIFLFGGAAISWKSKLQKLTAQSTVESEYVALNSACREAVYLRQSLIELGIKLDSSTIIHEDNQGAINLATSIAFRDRTKHIRVNFHYVREMIQESEIQLVYCPTEHMIADVMTKPLDKIKFQKFVKFIFAH